MMTTLTAVTHARPPTRSPQRPQPSTQPIPLARSPRRVRRRRDVAGVLRRQLARPPAARERRTARPRSCATQWGGRLIRGWDESWMQLPFDDRRRDRPRRRSARRRGRPSSATRRRCCCTSSSAPRSTRSTPPTPPASRSSSTATTSPPTATSSRASPRERGGRVRWIDVDLRVGRHRGRAARGGRSRDGRGRAEPCRVPLRLSRGCRGPHPHRARRRRAHPVGPLPLRRLRAGRGRCVGVRPRGRLHVQVPQRRAGLARVRLCRGAAPGRARAADPGLDGHAPTSSRWDPEYRPAAGMRRFLSGTPPIVGMLAMQDTLAMIEDAGIDAIRAKSDRAHRVRRARLRTSCSRRSA